MDMDIQEIWVFAKIAWVIVMMIVFFGIVFWALRPQNKQRFEDAAMIPLKDEINEIGT